MDDDYVDRHFGSERAQYEKATAFALLDGGNIGLSTIKARNIKSNLHPGKNLIVFKFKCMSKERGLVHTAYMVFENKPGGEYIEAPDSYCTCENGALFCSHMLCFLYLMRCIQVGYKDKTQQEIEKLMPEDRRIVQGTPCLIELILAKGIIKRQKAQSTRQSKRKK